MSKTTKPKTKNNLQLAVIHHHTAAIDVGSMLMTAAYTNKQGQQQLMETDGFTESLQQLVQTFKAAGVTNVAMEATGVYWMALYELMEEQGLKVTLVNPKHFKNVDAQKTDVKDSQWLHQLHAHGLLRASHIAPELYRELRSYVHERNILQKQKSDTLNRIQRLLTKMNIKVQHLISDIEGVSGMRILRAIAKEISNPKELLSLINIGRLKASKEDLLKSLKGVYKQQSIAILNNSLKAPSLTAGCVVCHVFLLRRTYLTSPLFFPLAPRVVTQHDRTQVTPGNVTLSLSKCCRRVEQAVVIIYPYF